MMSTCQNSNFTLGIRAPLIKFKFALRSPPSHHLEYGSSLWFAPNFLYNGAMGSHCIMLWVVGFEETLPFLYINKIMTLGLFSGCSLGVMRWFLSILLLLYWICLHAWLVLVYIFHLAWIDACKLSCMHHWFRVLF